MTLPLKMYGDTVQFTDIAGPEVVPYDLMEIVTTDIGQKLLFSLNALAHNITSNY